MRRTHEALDPNTAKDLYGIYEKLIDFGAHPNQFGVITAMRKSRDEKQVSYSVGILHAEPLAIVVALRMAVAVATGALKTFQVVFPERLTLAGIDLGIQKLLADANALFKSYAHKKLELAGPANNRLETRLTTPSQRSRALAAQP